MPGTDFDMLEGPEARIVALRRPGKRYRFMLMPGTLLNGLQTSLFLFLVNLSFALFIGAFEVSAEGFWRWFGPLALGSAAAYVSWLFIRAYFATQTLDITPRRIRYSRSWGKREWGVVKFPVGAGPPAMQTEKLDEGRGTWMILKGPAGEKARIVCTGAKEAAWLISLVNYALGPEAGPRKVQCLCCGAPLTIAVSQRARGHVNCSHCESGFVLDGEELKWGPVVMPEPEGLPLKRPADIIEEPATGVSRWRMVSRVRPADLFFALVVLYALLLFGGMGTFIWYAIFLTPPGTIGMKLYMFGGGIMMFAFCAVLVLFATSAIFRSQRLCVDDTNLWQDALLAVPGNAIEPRPMPSVLQFLARVYRPEFGLDDGRTPSPGPAGWLGDARFIPLAQRVPLILLTRIAFHRVPGLGTVLEVRTPNRSMKVLLTLPAATDHWLREQLLTALRERLAAMGREVRFEAPGQ